MTQGRSQAGEAGGPPGSGTSPGSGSLGARQSYQLTQLAPEKS